MKAGEASAIVTCPTCGAEVMTVRIVGIAKMGNGDVWHESREPRCPKCALAGQAAREKRTALRIGFHEAAEAVGVGIVAISNYERGKPGGLTAEQAVAYRTWLESQG